MITGDYILYKIDNSTEIPFSLLLLADETKEAIEKYIYKSDVYTLHTIDNPNPIGVFALFSLSNTTIEIKNIGILNSYRGRGIGSFMIEKIQEIAVQKNCKEIIVGTPVTGKREVNFYVRNGFVQYSIIKDFFIHHYTEPIIEDGVRLRDMVMLKMVIDIGGGRNKELLGMSRF